MNVTAPAPPPPPMESERMTPWYHGWAMDALLVPGCFVLSDCITCCGHYTATSTHAQNAPDHGRDQAPPFHGVRMHQTMVSWLGHGCAVGPWMLCAQNALRRPWTLPCPAPPLPPWPHASFQTPVSVKCLQFLKRAGFPFRCALVADAQFLMRTGF